MSSLFLIYYIKGVEKHTIHCIIIIIIIYFNLLSNSKLIFQITKPIMKIRFQARCLLENTENQKYGTNFLFLFQS